MNELIGLASMMIILFFTIGGALKKYTYIRKGE
jgi:hypothetical protein